MSASAVNSDKMSSRRRFDSSGGRTVLPEPANGKSYMESVFNFIHDLSQAYSNTAQSEEKETITWAQFFSYTDMLGYEEMVENVNSPILLVLGYSNGMQMWNLLGTGEAQEVFSMREGPVKTMCILPPPPPTNLVDGLQTSRPLVAICIATDSKQLYASVSIRSLRSGDQLMRLQFPSDVLNMSAGPAPVFLVTLKDSIHGFDTRTLNKMFVLNGCFNGTGFNPNPTALGRRWLAYSPASVMTNCQSQGGVAGDGAHSYVSSVISAAKTIGKGIFTFSDTVNWLAAKSHLAASNAASSNDETSPNASRERLWGSRKSSGPLGISERGEPVPGLVTILDIMKLCEERSKDEDSDHTGHTTAVEINSDPDPSTVVAHFIAHAGQPITCLEFCSSGRMLATADALGHSFHVYSVYPHPGGSPMGAVHHLYTLWRGETSAQVQGLCFSWDRRWLVANTLRGTCHVFPVAPYGGSPCVRTHTSDRVVNRSSRFHKSAGLDEIEFSESQPAPVHRPLVENPPPLPQGVLGWHTAQHRSSSPRSASSSNPRLPPLPHPVVVHALAHVRPAPANVLPTQSTFIMSSSDVNTTSAPRHAEVVIATRFLRLNGAEIAARSGSSSAQGSKAVRIHGGCQRLLIASSSGYLTEYLLDPRPQHGLPKVSDDSPVELVATPCVCWPLQRSASWSIVSLTLSPRNPLLQADDQCRRHHEAIRLRHKPRNEPHCHALTSSNGFDSIPLATDEHGTAPPLIGSKGVRNEQPKLRESKSKHSGKPPATPGGAVPFNHKAKGRKEKDPVAPVSEKIKRNGGGRNQKEETEREKKSLGTEQKVNLSEDDWPSQVEMVTHEGPARRLWMGPQFHFRPHQSSGNTHVLSSLSSALLSHQQHLADSTYGNGLSHGDTNADDLYDEELDVDSLPILSGRSEPVPTPGPRLGGCQDDCSAIGCCTSLSRVTIEAGSGNFDKVSHMLEVNNLGSLEEPQSLTGRVVEDKLKERIADAMVELNGGNPQTKLVPTDFGTSPTLLRNRTRSDGNDFESLGIVPGRFEFSNNDNQTMAQLPTYD
uniref:Breast carcinoma-amplified sequence 3 homolog n=1 Tax=Phallusia mammillata TaxID=59560 RepID=A0A6F9D7A5_9ASCI|nr:breast carcinoma-amplified sequence 3 homolog [Phallusia mammillata]